jgi:hypothetical protein
MDMDGETSRGEKRKSESQPHGHRDKNTEIDHFVIECEYCGPDERIPGSEKFYFDSRRDQWWCVKCNRVQGSQQDLLDEQFTFTKVTDVMEYMYSERIIRGVSQRMMRGMAVKVVNSCISGGDYSAKKMMTLIKEAFMHNRKNLKKLVTATA